MNGNVELLGYWPGKRWKQARAVFSGSGLSPTLTAEMGGHGSNYVYVAEEEDDRHENGGIDTEERDKRT